MKIGFDPAADSIQIRSIKIGFDPNSVLESAGTLHMTSFPKDVPFWGFVDMPSHSGGQIPQKPQFEGLKGDMQRFLTKMMKK